MGQPIDSSYVREVLGEVWLGRIGRAPEAVAALDAQGSVEARAGAMAVRLAQWLAVPNEQCPVDRASIEAFVGASPEARRAASFACTDLALLAFIAGDLQELAALEALHRQLANNAPPDAQVLAQATSLYRRAVDGVTDDFDAASESVARNAHQENTPHVVLAVQALKGYAYVRAQNLDAARAVVRRASRMARTEAMPQYEYLANVVLARVRRLSGSPHLATRILTALTRLAPTTWHPWLAWELALAGSGGAARDILTALPAWVASAPRAVCTAHLLDVLDAATRGDPDAFERGAEALLAATSALPYEAREALAILSALDPTSTRKTPKTPGLSEWLDGTENDAPGVICGLSLDTGGGRADLAHVLVRVNAPSRRFLSLARALVEKSGLAGIQPDREQERRDAATAILAFSPPTGYREEEFFEIVYGLAYEPSRHRGTLDTLLYRVRDAIGDRGQVERADGRVRFTRLGAFVIVDPRCAEPLPDRVLRIVASSHRAAAKEIADELGVPLRTVQQCLADLAQEGAFEVTVDGRRKHYRIVDTTFSEPTSH